MNIGLNSLRQIRDFALENNETNIIHLGDTFNLKDRIPSGVWVGFLNELALWGENKIQSYWLKGNHDFQTDVTVSAFKAVQGAHPIVEPAITFIEDFSCGFLPYQANQEKYMFEGTDLFFLHDFFKGKSYIYDFVPSTEGIPVPLGFKYVIAGHSHFFQEIVKNKVWHLGSPYQTSFNEVGQKKFFAQITPNSIQFHPFQYPEFIELQMGRMKNVEGCYVKVKYDEQKYTQQDLREFRKRLESEGALGVKMEAKQVIREKKRMQVKEGGKGIDYLGEYVKIHGGVLNHTKLKAVGLEIMERSKDEQLH